MVQVSLRGLLGLVWLALPFFVQAMSAPAASPPADHDLICSPTDVTDCYPRVFVPTKDFQPIREGQDLPPGLHVRMNVYEGTKEARLNIPMEGEEGASLEAALYDLPTEQSVVVVPQPESEEAGTKPAMRDQVPMKPPTVDTAGKILPPAPDGTDMGTFQKAMISITMEARAFDSALDDLMELSHDIYYGLEIAKNGPVLEKLICLILGSGSEKMPAKTNGRDKKAASILASSVQNNPTALKEVAKFGNMVFYPICAEAASGRGSEKGNFVSTLRGRLGREKDAGALKAKITAISGLLRDDTFRAQFLENGGMELLLAIFLKKGDEFDSTRQKVAQLVTDNFLDEGMGAKLGVWPKMPVTEEKLCKTKERMLEDGCWESHIGAFSAEKPKQAWAKDFLVVLKEQRETYGDSIKDREL
ncbi:related to SLS1 protein precursor [Phialocephala subalpina]|uniref:Nucleotide exchange factor SIL1 n=1 Tax=Phialocephala subalpina TaxID=576137 RepID=A0A1L7WN08_9HELO|nr:related to SLS1 protein precursor [Phialocephala subalpina]